jgi:sugar lactone lactonase YvrE
MSSSEWEVVLDVAASLGEGPVWVDDELWWVDIEGERIHRSGLAPRSDTVYEMGEQIGSVIPRSAGGFVAGMADGVALFGADGREELRISIEAEDALARMNDAKCDPAGRLFTGTMTHDHRRSALYRVDSDHCVSTMLTRIGISNGLGWNLAATKMYYIDTPTKRVDVFDYDRDTGDIGNRMTLIEVDENQGFPDGMTVDAEGCLWVAFWGGGCVRRFGADGQLIRTVKLPATQITSCAFGGPDLDRLFVTSATSGLSMQERADQPLAGGLFEIDPGCLGLASTPFAG